MIERIVMLSGAHVTRRALYLEQRNLPNQICHFKMERGKKQKHATVSLFMAQQTKLKKDKFKGNV